MTDLACVATESEPDAGRKTSVYLYFDRAGRLLYVGITSQRTGRQSQHSQDKDWWQYVASQEVEHFDTREQAADREKALIRERRPPFNRANNPGWERVRDAYLQVLASENALADIQSGRSAGFSYLSPCGGHCSNCRMGDPAMCHAKSGFVDQCEVCEEVGCSYQIGLSEGRSESFSNLANSRKYLAGLLHDEDEKLARMANVVIGGTRGIVEFLDNCPDPGRRAMGALIGRYLTVGVVDRVLYQPALKR